MSTKSPIGLSTSAYQSALASTTDIPEVRSRLIGYGLHANFLTALAVAIADDPSIPSCSCRVPEDLALHAEHLTW